MENTPDAELDFSEKELEAILDLMEQWYAGFEKSPQYGSLSGYPLMVGASVVLYFAEYLYTHMGQQPADWTPQGIEEVCLRVMPGKIAAGPEFFNAAPQVLLAFLAYAQEQNLLPHAGRLRTHLANISNEMAIRASDEGNWSMSKEIAMMALKAGVDLEDEDQVRHFMQMVNHTFEEQAWNQPEDEAAEQDE